MRYTVVRWDQEAELLLLTPTASPSTNNVPVGEQARTRWAFENMVDLVEKDAPKSPSNAQNLGRSTSDATAPALAARTKHMKKTFSDGAPVSIPTIVNFDTTSHVRRAAQLDSRVEIRRCPKRGRGLFALRNIPKGTEVMRAPATAAVLLSRERQGCSTCLLKAVGALEACHVCSLGFCPDCKKYGTCGSTKMGGDGDSGVFGRKNAMCELTKELLGVCAMHSKGGPPDEGIVRVLADVFIRRKAGMIDDEEWDMLNSLESHDNKDHTMSLPRLELQKCARLFKDLVDIELSDEEIQTMYRRYAFLLRANESQVHFGMLNETSLTGIEWILSRFTTVGWSFLEGSVSCEERAVLMQSCVALRSTLIVI